MKCARPTCPNKAIRGKNRGYCLKHYERLPDKGFVDAAPVRERLQTLRAMGYGHHHLADTVGITRQGLEWILNGKSSTVQVRTRDAVMRIPVPSSVVGMGALVSSVGTVRRVQALAVLGWPQYEIAKRAGMDPKTLSRAAAQPTVLAVNAAAVAQVFTELQMTAGPSEWVRLRAAKKGWAAPLAWDEDTIDDPDAHPSLEDRHVPFVERLAEAEFMNIRRSEIPSWMGIQAESLERQLQRHNLKEAV